jgi:ATP-dependent DNA helicase PIF1
MAHAHATLRAAKPSHEQKLPKNKLQQHSHGKHLARKGVRGWIRKENRVAGQQYDPPHFDGLRLSPEQAKVVQLAENGRNIFYTGSPGCGKSTVLRAIVQRLKQMGKRVRVLAPTSRAALAVNGTITWSVAGWSPNSHKLGIQELKAIITSKKNKTMRKRLRRTDVAIFDEISMVENLHFERLNQVMKAARDRPDYPAQDLPFGGAQEIITGDFAQLPPVKPFQNWIDCGS